MKVITETCGNCGGYGEVNFYKIDKQIDDRGIGTAHPVREKCTRCDGKGYVEEYVQFTVEEARAILKYCGLSTES